MPELPEVEIISSGLRKYIVNRKILDVKIFNYKLRRNINDSFINDVKNTTIKSIKRRAKYIIIELSNGKSILCHLGMTGQLTLNENLDENNLKKHTHVIIKLDSHMSIIYNDVRRFGLMISLDSRDVDNHDLISHIGIEPLSDEFNGEVLFKLLSNKTGNIKAALLNQKIVCGIGNIYACEALFYANISPLRKANSLSSKEADFLAKHTKRILKESIEAGGSTLRDYVQSDGSMGGFQNNFAVYGRAGEKCIVCDDVIKNIKQGGRSTFYCSKCQK
ncbi:MAG: bifunctional DNA-formamidopyrimidine glycosylase/DNA-(apurinic or apyrimidinic site) lyase [Alphaproteobacteria bacterium]|jgi:formamidopyrimidine-DNA glycosylase|nr:bifunctional DNA-formamidopyrimidine glycosylase/DNA-(apurinic or apyrimidinic site) lyase [Alphaproteobacteria bacterium]